MMSKKKRKRVRESSKLIGQDRVIDLLERIGVVELYLSTDLNQNAIAKKLGMDIHRVNQLLKGLKRHKK